LLGTAAANIGRPELARATTDAARLRFGGDCAGAARLARQLVVESALLGVAGGAAGLPLRRRSDRALPAILPADFPVWRSRPRSARRHLCARVTLVTSIACGLLPALLARRVNLVESLTDGGRRHGGGGCALPRDARVR